MLREAIQPGNSKNKQVIFERWPHHGTHISVWNRSKRRSTECLGAKNWTAAASTVLRNTEKQRGKIQHLMILFFSQFFSNATHEPIDHFDLHWEVTLESQPESSAVECVCLLIWVIFTQFELFIFRFKMVLLRMFCSQVIALYSSKDFCCEKTKKHTKYQEYLSVYHLQWMRLPILHFVKWLCWPWYFLS